jgi:hypothetical protein
LVKLFLFVIPRRQHLQRSWLSKVVFALGTASGSDTQTDIFWICCCCKQKIRGGGGRSDGGIRREKEEEDKEEEEKRELALGSLVALLLSDHEALDVRSVDHPAIDLELVEGVVYLVRGELLAPGHQRVSEPAHKIID